jgi:hypothetical protein
MLDPRIYRAAVVPALVALVIAAFSIQSPPRALTAGLPPDSFSAARSFAGLRELAATHRSRPPGGRGDRALARRVAGELRSNDFQVTIRRFNGGTARGSRQLETVVGRRVGLSSRQIVVVAHRDALSTPGTVELSGTAALLELARVFQGRTLHKTLVLVSTSGGSGGAAGAAEAARHLSGPVDAVLVLGDLAGRRLREPVVVPWSNGGQVAPTALRATVAAAVQLETGLRPVESGLIAQFSRLAFPLTVGEQGEIAARGFPAVLLSVSGERGPGEAGAVQRTRLGAFGRAALRSITALDARVTAPPTPHAELSALRKLLPGWAVRLLVGALILPGLLAAIDGFARVRRRRQAVGRWIVWVLAGGVPLACALVFGWLLELVGLMPSAPPTAAPVGAVPLGGAAAVALVAVALAGVAGGLGVRPAVLRSAQVEGDASSPGAAAALSLVLAVTVSLAWVFNPFAAALLLPALHGWMLLAAPEIRVRQSAARALVALTLLPLAVVVLYYSLALGAHPLQLLWNVLLVAVGGQLGVLGPLSWSVLTGCLVAVLGIVRAKRLEQPAPPEQTIRGPAGYAGPGSLGGTESALRPRAKL